MAVSTALDAEAAGDSVMEVIVWGQKVNAKGTQSTQAHMWGVFFYCVGERHLSILNPSNFNLSVFAVIPTFRITRTECWAFQGLQILFLEGAFLEFALHPLHHDRSQHAAHLVQRSLCRRLSPAAVNLSHFVLVPCAL